MPADVNLGQFRESREQIDFTKRIVGAPPDPAGFRPIAAEHPLADGESAVIEVLRRNPDAGAGPLEDPEPLRKRHRSAGQDERKHDGEANPQAGHGWLRYTIFSGNHCF
jgi:hypothetical protein